MKPVAGLILGFVFFVVLLSCISHAQMMVTRNYDPKTEITLKARVIDVAQVAGKRGCNGTHLSVTSDSGTLDVVLGPSRYIEKQQFLFRQGDEIEIVGSKLMLQGAKVIIARQIVKDGKSLVLRSSEGIPNWSGRSYY